MIFAFFRFSIGHCLSLKVYAKIQNFKRYLVQKSLEIDFHQMTKLSIRFTVRLAVSKMSAICIPIGHNCNYVVNFNLLFLKQFETNKF